MEQANTPQPLYLKVISLALLISVAYLVFRSEKKPDWHSIPKNPVIEDLSLSGKFIYLRQGGSLLEDTLRPEMVVSDALGDNIKILKQFPLIQADPNKYYGYPSPQGSYYILDSFKDRQKIREIYNLKDESILEIKENENGVRWSADERFVATFSRQYLDEAILVYDLQKKKVVFKKNLTFVGYGPNQTFFTMAWDRASNTLYYTLDRSGIKKIQDLESEPFEENFESPAPCRGMAIKGEEFYCHEEMSNVFTGSSNFTDLSRLKAWPSYSARIFKLVLEEGRLKGPYLVTQHPIDGEYSASLSFIDDRYLIANPALGGETIVDTHTGMTFDHNRNYSPRVEDQMGIFKRYYNQTHFPIPYFGKILQ